MSKSLTTIIFVGIIFLASFLRLWQLGTTPVSPDWDEVALGYDAYSLLHTGRDEFGNFMPVVLRSYDDYKPALYIYLAVPSVEAFGLDTYAVRLPSAVFGIMTVIAVYFLVEELFTEGFILDKKKISADQIALLSAFLLAISPWHIQFSRVAFESNIGLSLNVFAGLFIVKGLKRPWLLSVAAVFAALSIYAYQSEKVFTPLFIISLLLIYRKSFAKLSKKYLVSAFIIGSIVILPMILYIGTHKEALNRAQTSLAFSDQTNFLKNDIHRLQTDKANNDLLGLVLDNRRVLYIKTGIAGYFSHFDPNWLFIKGDLARHHAPGMGLLYLWELPFILIGIYFLIFNKYIDKTTKQVIFAWLLIAPIPAAFTNDVPHAVRTLNFLPTFPIFASLGVIVAIKYVSSIKYEALRFSCFAIGCLFFVFNILYYLNQYFVQQNYFYASDWQYGYAQMIPQISTIKNNYSKIIISDKNSFDKSYMFFLYYLKFDPAEYQKLSSHDFGKYNFRTLAWKKDKFSKDSLLVGAPADFPIGVKVKTTIYFPNGNPAMLLVDPKDNLSI